MGRTVTEIGISLSLWLLVTVSPSLVFEQRNQIPRRYVITLLCIDMAVINESHHVAVYHIKSQCQTHISLLTAMCMKLHYCSRSSFNRSPW
uniref:Secreted protein n=1 Tax=Arion vulgaris TaxID=1028688 RepID=A0A0B6XUH2_9EUPU